VRLLSLNVGLPREIEWRGQKVSTAIWKHPVEGRRLARRLNVDGDEQADLVGHGGEQRAVFVYQIEAYRYWEEELGRDDLIYGQFGENFTVAGLPDDEVCVGDRFRIGSAVFEVTQPRVTCYKVGIRLDEPRMPALLTGRGRPGFYLRVLEEGDVGAGDAIQKVADGPGRLSVREVSDLLYLPGHSTKKLERALALRALSPGWRASFEAMLERAKGSQPGGGNAGLGPATSPPPAWRGFRPFRVVELDDESVDVRSYALEPIDESTLLAWLPGQFVTLRVTIPGDARPLLRSYSLSSAPNPSRFRISVKREGRASSSLHASVDVGDVLDVAAPRGTFTLDPIDANAVEGATTRAHLPAVALISAGVGATPVLSMLGALSAAGSHRHVWWVHGARNRSEHSFTEEAQGLLETLPNGHRHVRYSRPAAHDLLGQDYDASGRIDIAALQALGIPHDGNFFVCGPTAFLRDLREGLSGWGVSSERVHIELFGPDPDTATTRPPPHPPAGPRGAGPEVAFARSRLSVNWSGAFASLLELAEACGVPTHWSCRTGVCHTCETALVDGAVDYDPEPLDAPAEGYVLACCARPSTAVTLDL
jgi:ferredoxin-NADP reductase/MOSC domain-containing protein YiiM